MPDDEKPAVEPSPTEEPAAPVAVEEFTDEQRSEWLKTGKTPEGKEVEAKPAESPPASAPGEGEKPKENEAEEKTDSEPVEVQKEEPKRKGAEERKAELAADVQTSLKRRSELRSEVQSLEQKKAELTASPPAKQELETEVKPRPKQEDFEYPEDWQLAVEKWHDESTDRKISSALQKDRKEQAQEGQKKQQEALNQEVASSWKKKTEDAEKVHDDFGEILANDDLVRKILPGSIVDIAILGRPEGAELFYYLGKHPEELDSIQKLPTPLDQAFALANLENKIVQGRGSVKRVTKTLPPAPETAGTGTVEDDPLGRAISEGETGTYMDLANAKELASLKSNL